MQPPDESDLHRLPPDMRELLRPKDGNYKHAIVIGINYYNQAGAWCLGLLPVLPAHTSMRTSCQIHAHTYCLTVLSALSTGASS